MTAANVFVARDVAKSYGDLKALGGVSLEIPRGEILGLVGPNGAGKTTFIKSCLGIVRPDAGKIEIDGVDVTRRGLQARRRTGYLPGESSLYAGMKARNFLHFCMDFYPEIDEALREEMLAEFKLPLKKRVKTYSTGMKKKLLIIQALCVKTPFILLDEPTDTLDPTTRIYLLAVLKRLAGQGRTILFSSHQLDEVEQICDRIAFLNQGTLLDYDRRDAIRKKVSRLIRFTLREPVEIEPAQLPGVRSVSRKDEVYVVEAAEDPLNALRSLSQLPIESMEFNSFRLSELYADLYGVKT